MPIDLTSHESPVTPAGELKLTDQEVAYLQSFLDRGDRGGYYMAHQQASPIVQQSIIRDPTCGTTWQVGVALELADEAQGHV